MKHWTDVIVFACGIVLIFWTTAMHLNTEPGDTVSEVILAVARRNPLLPLMFGVLIGHLFWSQQ